MSDADKLEAIGSIGVQRCMAYKREQCLEKENRAATDEEVVAEFYVYSKTEPVIEMTEDVEIRRFNGEYDGMEAHFKAANLNIHMNMWDKVFDFSKRDKDLGPAPHFKLMKLVPTPWKATGERTTKRPRLGSVTSMS